VSAAFPPPTNPPDRPALSYRLGTRSDFLRWMLAQLPQQQIPDGPNAGTRPLANLATHSPRDPAVALLDAFAVVADVLTFYEERIVNEGFLRTAGETRSVMELARAIGYELSPGLAAGAWLAFTVEEAAGAAPEVVIDPGVRVLSVPGQNQQPQTFETVERIVARPEWNQLRPMVATAQDFTPDMTELWVNLAQANLPAGEALLFVSHDPEADAASPRWALRTVTDVTPYPASGRARVALVSPSGTRPPVPSGGRVYVMNQRAAVFGHNAPDWKAMPASIQSQFNRSGKDAAEWPNFTVALTGERLLLDNLYPKLLPATWMVLASGGSTQLYWADSIQTIGHADFTLTARCTAPELLARPGGSAADISAFESALRGILVLGQGGELPLVDRPLVNETWGRAILAPFPNVVANAGTDLDQDDKVALDGVVPGLAAGRTLLVTGKQLRARVRAGAGVTVTADSGVTASYAQGETLFVVARPVQDSQTARWRWRLADAGGFEGTVDLLAGDLGLEPAAASDPVIAEVAILEEVQQTPVRTTLRFTAPLKRWYDRATTALSGNVAVATHGETVSEVIGSGDGSQANQRFALRRTPLTWVSAATPTGRLSTLEIRVDGVLWNEVSSFHDQSANSRVYLSRRDDQGRTTVVFGDGVHGARLPSGLENVVARYRIGTGLDGEVGAGKLMLFQTRPLGLRAVTNPLPATGAEAPATGAAAKPDIPRSVLTLDRVVSLTDHETFARTFAGIGKARAALLRRGEEQRVHLTLALADGSPVPDDAVILDHLRAALDAARDTTTPVEMAGHGRIWFRVAAKLTVAQDHRFASVAAAASEAMTRAFAFDQRGFGQDVSAAEVVALLQGVPGVDAVDLDGLKKVDPSDDGIPVQVTALLTAEEAHWSGSRIAPGQLLLLDPSPRGLTFSNPQEQP
jgi:hypothetical protein